MMEKKQTSEQKLRKNLIPTLVGVTVFVLTLTVFRPVLINVAKLRLENSRQRKKLAALERKSQLLQSLDEDEVGQRVIKLEEVFPSEKPVLNLIASLIELARENDVNFGGMELNPGKISQQEEKEIRAEEKVASEEAKLQEVAISFSIEGVLNNITSFITQLEKTAPLMKIESIGLSLEGPRASLGVRVYYQGLPESLGPIDQPVLLLSQKERSILEEIADYRRAEVIRATAPVGKEDLFSLP